MNDLLKQLKDLRTEEKLGGLSGARRSSISETIQKAVTLPEEEVKQTPSFLSYYKFISVQFISKPIVAGAAAFVILGGGWLSSVNAASQSLPGDHLYGLKIASEQLQLKLSSKEHKAVLHTEFASKRYDEVSKLRANPEREVHAQNALSAMKRELELAAAELEALSESGNVEAVKVALETHQNLENLNRAAGDSAKPQISEEDVAAIREVQESTNEVEETVYNALTKDEGEGKPEAERIDIEKLFKREMQAMRARIASNIGRIIVLRGVSESGVYAQETTLAEEEFAMTKMEDRLIEAQNFMGIGGTKRAFQLLGEIEDDLAAIESQLAGIEIAIVQASVSAAEEVEDSLILDVQEAE
ncbi:MAG: DUF5667 domain-containing protein [bacterium]|nr:DUF5667 domain-containing protein [bacterium]